MLLLKFLKETKRSSIKFYRFTVLILFIYLLQFFLRIEITPLGYFSLYSDATPALGSYKQILPCSEDGKPINIYQTKGTAFLMLEILPHRYKILKESDHCNQMNFRLQRLGLKDNNSEDCRKLQEFYKWFDLYMKRIGVESDGNYKLEEIGFLSGELLNTHTILRYED